MDYEKGYVYELMNQGGHTDVREAYFIVTRMDSKNEAHRPS